MLFRHVSLGGVDGGEVMASDGQGDAVSGYLQMGRGTRSWPSLVCPVPCVLLPLGFGLWLLLTYQNGHRTRASPEACI